ncbi:hypothetical protein, partial [Salmonella enterica]|uniref:hypothetical protein n=2 Tax=Salmonella enterica TaxID=28901 RepID=UPI001E282C58
MKYYPDNNNKSNKALSKNSQTTHHKENHTQSKSVTISFQRGSGYHDDRGKGWITIAVRIEEVLINFFDKILITVRMLIIKTGTLSPR